MMRGGIRRGCHRKAGVRTQAQGGKRRHGGEHEGKGREEGH